ncbi:MAG: radical SAM protein [Polyangiaceae bacterium]|nr:radical SAM protein [Polyangiaceae bacterium]MCL4753819.1 radical SAM protein [Myxococcales bacterium]
MRLAHRRVSVGEVSKGLSTRHEIGSAYRELLVLVDAELALGRKDHLLSLFAGEEDLVHLDLEGRLHRAWLGGSSFQRGLDGRVRQVSIARHGTERSLAIQLLPDADAGRVLERVGELVHRAAGALRASVDEGIAEPLRRAVEQLGAAARAAEAERYRAVYQPIPILPPDQNRALVLQLTSGCSWNRCTFCHLYRDVSFSLKTPDALRAHVRGVLGLVGRALPLRRGVFLGQANALVVAQDKLLPLLDVVQAELASAGAPASLASLSAFIDAFSKPKSVAELAELRARGLTGVSLGLESGSDEVLATLGKPAESAAAVELAASLHAAGVGLGVIVLVGAGGQRLAERHVEATVDVIARMRLGRGDRVYLSPLHLEHGSAFERSLTLQGALSSGQIREQAGELREKLRAAGVSVPIALYDIRRFVY